LQAVGGYRDRRAAFGERGDAPVAIDIGDRWIAARERGSRGHVDLRSIGCIGDDDVAIALAGDERARPLDFDADDLAVDAFYCCRFIW